MAKYKLTVIFKWNFNDFSDSFEFFFSAFEQKPDPNDLLAQNQDILPTPEYYGKSHEISALSSLNKHAFKVLDTVLAIFYHQTVAKCKIGLLAYLAF